jgi:hypothetical protein
MKTVNLWLPGVCVAAAELGSRGMEICADVAGVMALPRKWGTERVKKCVAELAELAAYLKSSGNLQLLKRAKGGHVAAFSGPAFGRLSDRKSGAERSDGWREIQLSAGTHCFCSAKWRFINGARSPPT